MDIERLLLRLKEVVGDLQGSELVPSILGDLDRFDPIHFAPIEEIATDRWDHGRVVLIGDVCTCDLAQHGRKCVDCQATKQLRAGSTR